MGLVEVIDDGVDTLHVFGNQCAAQMCGRTPDTLKGARASAFADKSMHCVLCCCFNCEFKNTPILPLSHTRSRRNVQMNRGRFYYWPPLCSLARKRIWWYDYWSSMLTRTQMNMVIWWLSLSRFPLLTQRSSRCSIITDHHFTHLHANVYNYWLVSCFPSLSLCSVHQGVLWALQAVTEYKADCLFRNQLSRLLVSIVASSSCCCFISSSCSLSCVYCLLFLCARVCTCIFWTIVRPGTKSWGGMLCDVCWILLLLLLLFLFFVRCIKIF